MRIRARHLAALALVVLLPAPALAWGSLYPGETHQYIIGRAFERLRADPAFAPGLFPTLSAIRGHEGVQWTADGLFGVGPDGKGMSNYSEHYYNPRTGEGGGPAAAARYYTQLVRDNVAPTHTTEAAAKAAAWSAHFLADMFVPYHVVGTSRANAERIWVEQSAAHYGVINLGHAITGSPVLSYWTPVKGGNANFFTELSRFVILTEPPESDWFDPWYYNGNTETMMIKTSSHVAWEAIANGTPVIQIQRRVGQGLAGYDPQWRNAAPGFDSPWVGQAERVRQLAIHSATETRDRLESYFHDPAPALANAIQSVTTLWRSSISGLRPELAWEPDGANAYRVTGRIANDATADAGAVRVRLSARDCTLSGAAEQTLGAVSSRGRLDSKPWRVETADRLCHLKLEVIATYAIPDLQYAAAERAFSPERTEQAARPKPPEPAKPSAPAPASAMVQGRWRCWPHYCECVFPPEPWTSACSPEDKARKRRLCKDDGEYCGSTTVENAQKAWEKKKAGQR